MIATSASPAAPIKVLIVDDSPTARRTLADIIGHQPDMQLIGMAEDAMSARQLIRSGDPDVITLELNLPQVDGLHFIERLMQVNPKAIVLVTGADGISVQRGLQLGAIGHVKKPTNEVGLASLGAEIANHIRQAAKAHFAPPVRMKVEQCRTADAVLPLLPPPTHNSEKIIVIGASTGGTEAVREVLTGMPASAPPILVTQHMPETFTPTFAKRLDSLSRIKVQEAASGMRLQSGHAYIAPGHSHLLLKYMGGHYETELNQGPPVNRHRPSVDVLFRSAANSAGRNAVGIILSGMGKDGAVGMREMKRAGAYNFAQDEATCVVYGMPKEAVAEGGVDEVLALPVIASRVMEWLSGKR